MQQPFKLLTSFFLLIFLKNNQQDKFWKISAHQRTRFDLNLNQASVGCVCICEGRTREVEGNSVAGACSCSESQKPEVLLTSPRNWQIKWETILLCFKTDWHFNYSTAGSVNHTREGGDNSQLEKIHTIAWQPPIGRSFKSAV